jgi:hypothetical protein
MRIVWLLTAVCVVGHGCGSIPVVQQVPVPEVAPLPPGSSLAVVVLDRVVFDVPKDTVIGEARRGKARRGKARRGKARRGKARRGKARRGKARRGKACVSPEKLIWRAETPRTLTEGRTWRLIEPRVTRMSIPIKSQSQTW